MKRFWVLGGILLLAATLRLINIGAEPFWGDEILSLDIATTLPSFGEMVRYLREVEFHPPLYYLLLRGWTGLFGQGEAAVRMLSLLFSVGTVWAAYLLAGRAFRDARIGLIAALITAVLPFQIEFGQEARPYAIVAFFLTLAALSLLEYTRTARPRYGAGYVLASLAAVYFHYSASFFILAMAAWWLIDAYGRPDARRRVRDWFLAHAAMFLGFWWWLDAFLYKVLLADITLLGLPRELAGARPEVFFERTFHRMIWPNMMMLVTRLEIFVAFLVKVLLFISALFVAGKGVRSRGKEIAFFLFLAVTPVVIFLFAPQSVAYSVFFERHMIFMLVPAAILIAWLTVTMGRKNGLMLCSVFLISLIPALVLVLDNDAKWQKNFQLKSAGEYISAHAEDGDLVIHAVTTDRSNLSRYVRDDIPVLSLYPIAYREGGDPWSTRHTLGIIENELQLRWFNEYPSDEEVRMKLASLIDEHGAGRVWLYGLKDPVVHAWFGERGWRHAIRSIKDRFRVDLYAAP